MALTLHAAGTEYVRNAITLIDAEVTDVASVGVFHGDANEIPTVAQFLAAQLVDGVNDPDNPLATPDAVTVVSLIGPRGGVEALTPGTYQRWVLVTTANEDIIRRVDTITVI